MLRAACGPLWSALEPQSVTRVLAALDCSKLPIRGIRIIDIFNRTKAKERQQKLKEEASHGYWDDFKELKDTKGKIYGTSQKLLPASTAVALPEVQVLDPKGAPVHLRAAVGDVAVTLLCLAFRSGAEEMLASWSRPFGNEFTAASSQHIELSLVESVVMSWWPFRNIILGGRSTVADSVRLKPSYYFHFGSACPFVQTLQLSNRLTGYVFLVDGAAKVRWRGCGMASADEISSLLQAAKQITEE